MKKLLSISMCLLSLNALAQNTYFFSHYMFNPSYYNPSWVGVDREAFASLNYRNQWTGYSSTFDGDGGAPNTQLLSLVAPVQGGPISGLGLNVANDNLGPVSNFHLQLSASFAFNIKSGEVRIGVMPALFSQTQRFNELRFNDPSDPLNVGTRETQLKPDVSIGGFYTSNDNFFLGASVQNLLQPSFDFGLDSLENKQEISYILHGGTNVKVNEDFSVLPAIILRSNLDGWTFDLSAILMYQKRMWTGLSYRKDEALILFLGYSFLKDLGLKAGYSFDYVLSSQEAKQPTSHEIFVRYALPDFVFGGRKTVKTPRFIF